MARQLNHLLFRNRTPNWGICKYEVEAHGGDVQDVIAALVMLRDRANAGGYITQDGVCYNLHLQLVANGTTAQVAGCMESYLVYAFTGLEFPITGYRWEDGYNWEGEQLTARLELIDALLEDLRS